MNYVYCMIFLQSVMTELQVRLSIFYEDKYHYTWPVQKYVNPIINYYFFLEINATKLFCNMRLYVGIILEKSWTDPLQWICGGNWDLVVLAHGRHIWRSLHYICTVLAVEFGPHYSLTESFCIKVLKIPSEMQSCKQSDLYILYRRQFRQSDGICQGHGNSLIIQKNIIIV